jgi:KUP system potassium uptake protein
MYFVRNKTTAWKSLGGILLCFTGVEALFADLGAFSKRYVALETDHRETTKLTNS